MVKSDLECFGALSSHQYGNVPLWHDKVSFMTIKYSGHQNNGKSGIEYKFGAVFVKQNGHHSYGQ